MAAIIRRRWLPLASFSPANILAKLLTVDGSGSGIDADTVDGLHAVSGIYSPTATLVSNLDSVTAYSASYIQIGGAVFVAGVVTADATAAGATVTELGMSLPVASNLTQVTHLGGTGLGLFLDAVVAIDADATNDRARMRWRSALTVATNFSYVYGYRVL